MQLWKWILLVGLVFLIMYNPSQGRESKLVNYFTRDSVGGNGIPEQPGGDSTEKGA